MSKLYQTDPRLPEVYHTKGCNFLAHLGLCQSHVKHYLSPIETELIQQLLQESGALSQCLSLDIELSPWRLFKDCFKVLGYPEKRGEQVGQIAQGKVVFWKHVEEHCFDGVIAQLRLYSGGLHYVECDRDFRIIYNPNPALTQYKIVSYRLYHFWQEA